MFESTPFLVMWQKLQRRAAPPTPERKPLLLRTLLAQVPRQRTVHQVAQLRSLAVSWLEAPQDLQQLDLALQAQMRDLALLAMSSQPSPKSTSSSVKTVRRTGKRRR